MSDITTPGGSPLEFDGAAADFMSQLTSQPLVVVEPDEVLGAWRLTTVEGWVLEGHWPVPQSTNSASGLTGLEHKVLVGTEITSAGTLALMVTASDEEGLPLVLPSTPPWRVRSPHGGVLAAIPGRGLGYSADTVSSLVTDEEMAEWARTPRSRADLEYLTEGLVDWLDIGWAQVAVSYEWEERHGEESTMPEQLRDEEFLAVIARNLLRGDMVAGEISEEGTFVPTDDSAAQVLDRIRGAVQALGSLRLSPGDLYWFDITPQAEQALKDAGIA